MIAREISDDVWVVAPETEQSGASHSLTLTAPLRLRKPAPTCIDLAREIGHEKDIEMRQVIGQVFTGQHQIRGVQSIGRHLHARRVRQCFGCGH